MSTQAAYADRSVAVPRLKNVTSDLLAGALSTLLTLSYSVSYGVLIFSSFELRPFEADGVRAALMAAWVLALVVALGSSIHFTIAGPDSNATAILAVMASTVAHSLALKGYMKEDLVLGVLALLAGSAILTGLLVCALGAVKGGRIVRFIPYPVAGGFLAGTGWLIVAGATKVLTGHKLSASLLTSPPDVSVISWTTAALVALALLVLPKVLKHFLTVPAVILGGVGLFFALLWYTGTCLDTAREQGMIFQELSSTSSRNPIFRSPSEIPWAVLIDQWQNFFAMTMVVIVTVLLNCTGLELATKSDVNFDRELVVNGAANVLSGMLGGMIGYVSISRSLMNFKAGAATRTAGMVVAALCAGAAFLYTPALSYMPKPVLAGLLLYLGLSLLREWVWESFSKLPWMEYGLVITILLLIATYGLLVGVGFGILVSLVLFVYSYSRANCIRHDFSVGAHFSNKERPPTQTKILREMGGKARAL
ncbi:MAG: SulP family inorganic anion transporter, partial [Planctomycetota bacterium]|nr:SulP family inorganic anion transporter [Planctomycetota bacterium]